MKKLFKKKMREQFKKGIAMCLVVSLLFEMMVPTYVFALTGGPSQPEVQSFTPIGTSDMVDLFTGDFTYNIPLLDVDGYPINISYSGGITMDQEASWVGLGWNINPGVVNRAMRGLPDDFNGDEVTKTYNMKANKTFGVKGAFGFEIFGVDENAVPPPTPPNTEVNLNLGVGINFNNFNGMGLDLSANASISSADKSKSGLNAGLGLSSSSANGLSVQPSVGYSLVQDYKNENEYKTLGGTIGANFNSRMGLTNLTYGLSMSQKFTKTIKNNDGSLRSVKGGGSGGPSGSFDFGMPTYTPDVSLPMQNLSITGSFKLAGVTLFGATGSLNVSGYVSTQKLRDTERKSPAYGYMNSEVGQTNKDALMDFNRENEGSFMPTTPALALSNYTYDLFSVSGQGVGGSYRPFRSEIGHIFDPFTETTSGSGSIGVEIGGGNLFKGGVDISVTHVTSTSGDWKANNQAGGAMSYKNSAQGSLNEKFYFKEANEKTVQTDNSFFSNMGGADPMRFNLVEESKFNTYADDKLVNQHGGKINISSNTKSGREKRNQVISILSRNEVVAGFGVEMAHASSFNAPGHHIAEMTSLGADGRRYVYGIAAYNTYQKEVSFAVGAEMNDDNGHPGDCFSGLVNYTPNVDNSVNNKKGLDNYYSSTEMPPFAHSYLLTAVLSPDYVDSDNIPGPSKGDLGTWIKFNYTRTDIYNWRTPVGANKANFNEGLKSDPNDDKASYVYGSKELWYVASIETKNYIAVFDLGNRKDGNGVVDENGALDMTSYSLITDPAMKYIKNIKLYSKPDFQNTTPGHVPTPIKTVHFEYDYSLCPKLPTNIDFANGETDDTKTGKLTLKKVYFTYQNSYKAKFSPYSFDYGNNNPKYNLKGYDRWGNYKPNPGGNCDALSGGNPSTAEYPYVEQDDQGLANEYSSAWLMKKITLPSGGTIEVEYESDDYAYVQHKRASQMFKITGVEDNAGLHSVPGNTASISDNNIFPSPSPGVDTKNRKIYFDLQPGYNNISDYIGNQTLIYFRCLMEFEEASGSYDGQHDYVSGYAEIHSYGYDQASGKGWIKFNPVGFNDNGPDKYNPISKSAVQFGRMHLSRYVWNQISVGDNEGFGVDVMNAIITGFFSNFVDAISGPNKAIWNREKGQKLVLNKSWIRLYNPNNKKLGGGCRVKQISMSDEWGGMTGTSTDSYSYGQQYEYTLEDGTSSGVASYEPQLGGDENTFKQPVFFTNDDPDTRFDNLMTPREDFYQEEPLGESFFPSASVGYSRVTVKNIQRSGVSRTATGKVVHEFYTAKDFPTIVKRTDVKTIRNKNNPFSLGGMFKLDSRDHMTASQGFVIELNDMHGKPKKQMVYQEDRDDGNPLTSDDQLTPITSVEYLYETDPLNLDGKLNYRLKNTATVIHPTGQSGLAEIGVFFDMVADMRQNYTASKGGGVNLNTDGFLAAILPIVTLIPYPSISNEETQFRSASTTKVINRFGILKETIARDLGSEVSTRNLAYDAETGEVLLTQTTTDFNDDIYSLTYPSHWYYDGMGQAYKNIGYRKINVTFNSNGMTNIANAHLYFSEGDEVALFSKDPDFSYWLDDYDPNAVNHKGWITDVTSNGITVLKKDGTLVTGGPYSIKVIRSGRRNMQAVPIASITTLKNPLDNFSSNIFENVLQSSAMEFSQEWNTFCDCFEDPQVDNFTTNPYVLGTKGNWRMKRSWLHLSPRTQSNYDNNTNIRKDGMFTSYTPFYRLINSKWNVNEENWTFTSEVTEFSPFGQELENRDALGRYSAATFGFNQSLATSVAANARYRELGFDSFEDYEFSDCFDNHFKFKDNVPVIDKNNSHTGRNSIKVSAGSPASITKKFENCIEVDECVLAIEYTISSGTTTNHQYTIRSGVAPYSIDYEIINGNYVASINTDPDKITFTGSGPISVKVTVVDTEGCKQTEILNTYDN